MHIVYRIFIGLLTSAIILTFFSLFLFSGTYLLTHNPRAMDFLAFYTGAHLLSQSPIELYNLHAQLITQQQIDPITRTTAVFLPFLNPPFVAIIFLSLLPLGLQNAYAIWTWVNTILLLVLISLAYQHVKPKKWYLAVLLIIGIITFIPILTSVLIGQLSSLLCLIFLCAWISLKRDREFLGGLILSCIAIKPQYIILLLLALLLQRRKKLLAGFLTGIAILFCFSYLLVGGNGIDSYFSLLDMSLHWSSGFGIDLMAQHSLQTAFLILFQTQSLSQIYLPWIISIALIGLPTLFLWTKKFAYTSANFAYQFTILIVASLLISPHTHFHDLSLLVVVAIIILSVINKLKPKMKNIFIVLLSTGFAIELAGYLLDVQTQTATHPLWILVSVGYMLILWFFLFKTLIQSQKNIKNKD